MCIRDRYMGKPLIITGPSGAGKSTFIRRILQIFGDRLMLSVSHTTRRPRPGEVDGRDYYFTTAEAFRAQIAVGGFLEHEETHGNLYGTALSELTRINKLNKAPLLDIDIKGVLNVSRSTALRDANFFLIVPPSFEELERRLRLRKTESEESLRIRLSSARTEVEKALLSGLFPPNHQFINDDVEKAWKELHSVLNDLYPPIPNKQ
eukprot:TRINITY_DN3650_c0_g2_i1.p1 TRINITY_DN3650_c0_g2~~TRINITY_DN3650_c0_g2_i1.p1  ORF type:complete len:229 (-),score=50.03 TRINITY_DN3650_c0_g2_i1:109-726(-)